MICSIESGRVRNELEMGGWCYCWSRLAIDEETDDVDWTGGKLGVGD
jgi:hypothetical protein